MQDKSESKSTLSNLTKDLVEYLQQCNGQEVELSQAEVDLNANKRRLYDVINVLSGIGLIERCGKSKIKWIKGKASEPSVVGVQQWNEKEAKLDEMIQKIDFCLQELSNSDVFNKFGWLSHEDILRLSEDNDMKLFALKGPPSMTIQIEDDDDSAHRMICESTDDQIYLTSITNSVSK